MSQASAVNGIGREGQGSFRFLSFAPGQTWSGWALFGREGLLDTGITLTESYLEGIEQNYLDKLDVFNRRLLGLRLSVKAMLTLHAPLDFFVAWNPSASSPITYAARAGQYVGIMKSASFELGIPVIDVNDDEGRAGVGVAVDAPREELEGAITARLANLSLPSHLGTYDSGVDFKASPIDAITVGWVAQERFRLA